MARELAQIAVVPGGLGAVENPGVPSAEYQPMPNPSPFVGSAPIRDLRLWSISEYWPWYRTLSILIGLP